jgi:protein ImuB
MYYITEIVKKLNAHGYDVRIAMADTIGVEWAVVRFGKKPLVIPDGMHIEALMPLPPEALRLELAVVDRLHKLGHHQVRQFIKMPRSSLRRQFGQHFLHQLDKALG